MKSFPIPILVNGEARKAVTILIRSDGLSQWISKAHPIKWLEEGDPPTDLLCLAHLIEEVMINGIPAMARARSRNMAAFS